MMSMKTTMAMAVAAATLPCFFPPVSSTSASRQSPAAPTAAPHLVDDVADGPDAGHVCAAVLVHEHRATLAERHAHLLQAQAFGVGRAACTQWWSGHSAQMG